MSSRESKRPFITANFAITADGRISTRNQTPADFSSPRDKYRLIEIRTECDAIIAGAQTIAKDRMTMGIPDEALRAKRTAKGLSPYPHRVLLSAGGRIDPGLPLFQHRYGPVMIFSTTRMKPETRAALEQHATLYLSPRQVDLRQALTTLRTEHGIRRAVCEGGARILRALLMEDLVDELHVTVTPRIFGGRKAPTLTGVAGSYLPKSTLLRLVEFKPIEGECFLRYRIARDDRAPATR